MSINKKFNKSQVSIFLIVGAILVIVGIFLFVNNKYDLFLSPDQKLKNQVITVVNDCLEKSLSQGTFYLGYQGGYLYLPKQISKNPFKHLDLGVMMGVWDPEDNFIPTINSMESQLNKYVSQNSYNCIIQGLKPFEKYLYINVSKKLKVNVTINEDNVELEANLPISVKDKNSDDSISVSDYYVKLDPLRLGREYELAKKIYEHEQNTYFLEDLVMDQIDSASDYDDPDHSMPTEGLFFTCKPPVWTIDKLKSILANLNNNNFKYLYFSGTYPKTAEMDANLNKKEKQFFENPNTGYIQNIGLKGSEWKYLDVTTFMPSVQMTGNNMYLSKYPFNEFKVTPSEGQVVMPMQYKIDTAGGKLPLPCMQMYHHLYDLDYNLIMKITDRSPDGGGYSFQFPIRIQIKHNQPAKTSFIPFFGEKPTVDNYKYCSNESRKYPLVVYAKDAITGDYLSNVNVSFSCVGLTCSNLGKTEKPKYMGYVREAAIPMFKGDFPYCYNGKVIASKKGYHENYAYVTTNESLLNRDSLYPVMIELTPVKEFEISKSSFLAVDMNTGKGKRIITDSDGTFFINVKNVKYDFSSFAMLPDNSSYFNKLKLLNIKTKYNISLLYVDGQDKLESLLELKDYTLDATQGNSISFVVPSISSGITQDNVLKYFNRSMEMFYSTNPLNPYGIFIK